MMVLVFVFGFFINSNAWAEEFTLNVPVNLTSLYSDITKVRVGCEIKRSNNNFIAGNVVYGNVINGSINEVITVSIDTPENVDPNEVAKYTCQFKICREERSGSCSFLVEGHENIIFRREAGSPLNATSHGDIQS